ncbi:MAG: YcaO-like family protein [Desulfobacteraceae bacterium]
MPGKIILKDVLKGYTLDQDKSIPPEETVRRFRERLQGLDLDILQGTARIDNGRLDIPVFFSLCGRDARDTIGARKLMGKGGTPAQAEASAVMELAERFSLFSFRADPENFRVETYANLEDHALPFEDIARSVHDQSEDLPAVKEIFSSIPLRWTSAYNLTRDREVLIPFDWFYTINEYNGPSAGNCAEEALLQGICEVVERHVSSLVSRGGLRTPRILLDGLTDPLVREMLQKYGKAGVELYINDLTLDTGIPSIGVLAYDPATFPEKSEIVWTAGTTPSPEKSLSRALTETAQLAGDFNTSANYTASGLPKLLSLEQAGFVIDPGKEIGIQELPDISDPNLRAEVEGCLSALAGAGMEILAVDITHPLLGVPSFYTIIPGAHFRQRAAGKSAGMFTARLIYDTTDPITALGELQRMENLMPGKYYLRFYQGLCLLSLGEAEEALGYLGEALDLDPEEEDIPTVYSYMGQCLKEMERYQEAASLLQEGLAMDSERTDLLNLLGFCLFKLGRHKEAIECFEALLRLDPSSAIDYANIASNYRELGDRAAAVRYYRLALELDPGIEFARENLRRLEASAGD